MSGKRKKAPQAADDARLDAPSDATALARAGSESISVEPLPGAYHVALPSFEGPLDLLLHLIQQHELDVFDIPIGFITEKYVEYITLMQELNIDLASEYLVMAATLAHIKSKLLLPTPPSDQDDDGAEELDPRSELVRRLLEYQKYKQAAEELGAAPVLGRDVFLRGAPAPSVEGPAPLAPISVFKLFDAFQKLLSRVKQTAEHQIDVDRISISERILQLTDLLKGRGKVPFERLFDEEMTRSDLVVTFLAVLEMTRLRMMSVFQEGPLEAIQVELTLSDEHEDVLRDAGSEDPLAALARSDVAHPASRALAADEDSSWDGGASTPAPPDDGEHEPPLDAGFDLEDLDAAPAEDEPDYEPSFIAEQLGEADDVASPADAGFDAIEDELGEAGDQASSADAQFDAVEDGSVDAAEGLDVGSSDHREG